MKRHILTGALILIALVFSPHLRSQAYVEDVIILKNGNTIHGIIIGREPEKSVKIQTEDKKVLIFRMDEIEKIEKQSAINKKKPSPKDNSKFYFEFYGFGGFSSKKTIKSGTMTIADGYMQREVTYDMVYKNGGFGGIGVSWLFIGKGRSPDFMVDGEVAFYDAGITVIEYNPDKTIDFTGFVECVDVHFSLFPVKARNKYPSPYIIAGGGMRFVQFTFIDGNVSEVHGDFSVGIGIRQKISRRMAFEVCEQFVYSKLKEADAFILPETRFGLVFSFGN